MASESVELPWVRLHPLSPVFRAGRIALVTLAYVVQQSVTRAELLVMLAGLGLILIISAIAGFFSWRAMGYRVDGEHLEFKSGVFQREHRRLSLHRIETVDVAQPFLARLAGLAEVRVEAAAAGDGEIRLQYLRDSEAWALRDQLRAQAKQQQAPVAPAEVGEDPLAVESVPSDAALERDGEDIFTVNTSDVVWGYVIGRLIAFVPFVVVAIGVGIAIGGLETVAVGIVPFAIAIVSGIYSALRAAESMANFTILDHPDGLFIHRGLLNKLTQRVSVGRIQAVGIQEPFFWRLFGKARLTVDIAGYRSRDGQAGEETAILVPIASREECLRVLSKVVPGLDIDNVQTTSVPKQARYLEPVGAKYLSAGVDQLFAVTKFGILRKNAIVVPHEKVQSWRTTTGPLQRRLGLTTLHLDTAGSHLKFAARLQSQAVARRLLDESRAATR